MTPGKAGPRPSGKSLRARLNYHPASEDLPALKLQLKAEILRTDLPASDLIWASRLIEISPALTEGLKRRRMVLLGQCSLHGVTQCLAALAWADGYLLEVQEGGFDQIHQEMAAMSVAPDLIALVPWSQHLLYDTAPMDDGIALEMNAWRMSWSHLASLGGTHLLQVGYDWADPGPDGYHLGGRPGGFINRVRSLNDQLRRLLPEGAYFLDLESLSGTHGRNQFYDARQYHWTRQPFTPEGAAILARQLWGGALLQMQGPRKVLVVDLDNTVWGGIVGECGLEGLALCGSVEGEAFLAFQRHLKQLSARGVLLAVASKNDEATAREPFELHPDMVLKISDFAAFEAHWRPKNESLVAISRHLNLHLDSFVFFDDNPAERALIRQTLPDVAVVEVPADPSDYIRALSKGHWFEALSVTSEDRLRTQQYRLESERRISPAASNIEAHLTSLDMRGRVSPIAEVDLPRVVQLIAKTNQFNLTTQRYTLDQVRAFLSVPGSIHLCLRLQDRFGDLGLVGLLLGFPDDSGSILRIDTLLLSCRVIGRTAEHFLLNNCFHRAREAGFDFIQGSYRPTPKNGLVADLWPGLGFHSVVGSEWGNVHVFRCPSHSPAFSTCIQSVE